MTPTPNRRWLRFSLRTMFALVTALTCWLGYHVHWHSQRQDFVSRSDVFGFGSPAASYPRQKAPWSLRLFGAKGYCEVSVLAGDNVVASLEEARRLFPEANVSDVPDTGEGRAYFEAERSW